MNERRGLRLVAFNPNDYSLGEVLVKDTQEVVKNSDFISSALSLAFQWPNETLVHVIPPGGAPVRVFLDYDREERAPTELWVRFESANYSDVIAPDTQITIRFEIFRQCYDFPTMVVAVDTKPKSEASWHLIVQSPETLLVYKQRRLPRVVVDEDAAKKLKVCRAIQAGKVSGSVLRVKELGMRALRVTDLSKSDEELCFLQLGDGIVPARFERREGVEAVLSLRPQTEEEAGYVFDYYRAVAFPHLRPRSDFTFDDLLKLYSDTKYFDKFQTASELEHRLASIRNTWSMLGGETHKKTADYVIVDEVGELSGASSASFSFLHNEKPIWAFHQLCAKTKPDLLEQSGQLYTWRAEYLASRPEDLEVIGWFDSRSRWLERIYVKFAFHKHGKESLHPVSVYRKLCTSPLERADAIDEKKTTLIPGLQRAVSKERDILAGLYPKFLNASGILDAVISLGVNESLASLEKIAVSLLESRAVQEDMFEFTVKKGAEPAPEQEGFDLVGDVDRMFLFKKDALVDFLASVEHSVAVTLKKKEKGEVSEAS